MVSLLPNQPVYNYREYSDIPPHMQDYIKTVAIVDDIRDLFLTDINDFLNGLIGYEIQQENTHD